MRKSTRILISLVALVIASASALAQSDMVDGQVNKIDESASKITLKHGLIKKFDMDEVMTMVFRAQDPGMLKQVKVGTR